MPADDELLQGGRYQLLGKLGEGAQGTTFDGVDRKEGRPVAIKRFSVRGASSWKDVELAEREATVLASLSHPSLPAHVDHFEEDGALYLVMEKIEGQSLAQIVRGGGALSQADVMRFLEDVAGLLAYLHGRSPPVIHRDINPKNVIRKPDGHFVLVDFGAVRDRLRPEGGSTVVGTFGYMAPEQFQGRAVPASDVYAVGATALRLLTGVEPEKLPHKGLALDVPAALRHGFDPALRAALAQMLEPDPDRRAPSLTPIVERLTRARDRASDTARRRSARDDGGRGWRPGNTHEPFESGDANRRGAPFQGQGRGRASGARPEWEDFVDWENIGEWVDREARRHASRAGRRAWKRAERRRRRGRPVHGPPLFFAIVGLNVAMVVVAMILGVVVPLLLTLLSIFLGAPLRNAARRTRDAAAEARASLQRAERLLLTGPTEEAPPSPTRVDQEPLRTPPPRARIRVDDPVERREPNDADVVETTGTEVKGAREEL